ncbi:MAG: hypothetical protein KDC76_06820 [Bacteroidetes bacterium]|nr:hypothetical protein [Bacteroidota bacterium]
MNYLNKTVLLVTCFVLIQACKKDAAPAPKEDAINTIPEFFKPSPRSSYGENQPKVLELAGPNSGLMRPTDLDFNPGRSDELWVVNEDFVNTGGSTIMFTGISTGNPKADHRRDGNAWHFMSMPTGIAFGDNGFWATSPGILDANHQNGSFTGPALWSADLNVYAQPSGGNGSHMDMLHGSPYSMGIAWERDNVYWVTDGFNGYLVMYDFRNDHGAGNSNHDDGIIHRYGGISFKRIEGVPSHLEIDDKREFLYMVDNGNSRVLKIDLRSKERLSSLPLRNEVLADHASYKADYSVFSEDQVQQYCGIALNGDRVFLSDHKTGTILCIHAQSGEELGRVETGIEGITGLVVDKNNRLYFVSYTESALYQLQPQ